eukprot:tig00000704_g3339.t1
MRCLSLLLLLAVLSASAHALYGPGSAVELLTAKNFKEKVLASDEPVLVEFFAPWCGHCKALAPEYEKAAKNLKGIVRIAAVDCDVEANKPLAAEYGIKGFPTIKLFPAEGKKNPYRKGEYQKTPEDYNGPRTAKPIADFALNALPSKHVLPVTSKNLEKFLGSSPELPHAILFTEKATSPLTKALSLQFKGRLLLGEVKSSDKELTAKYSIEKFPSVIVLKPGDEAPVAYDGPMKQQNLHKFLSMHAAPKKRVEESASEENSKKKQKGSDSSSEQKETPPPEPAGPTVDGTIVHIVDDDFSFKNETCHGSAICIVALLDPADSSFEKHTETLKGLAAKHGKQGLFRFVQLDGPAQNMMIQAMQLASQFPQLISVSFKRGRFAQYFGPLEMEEINGWLTRISSGHAHTVALPHFEIVGWSAASEARKQSAAAAADEISLDDLRDVEVGKDEL